MDEVFKNQNPKEKTDADKQQNGENEERVNFLKNLEKHRMLEKQKLALEKKKEREESVHEYDALVDAMKAKSAELKRAGRALGDSFAMDMVKEKLKALEEIRDRKDIPDGEKQERLHIAMYDLEAVCMRYRDARYKGKAPVNTRHRIVESILTQATTYLDSKTKHEPDASLCFESARRKLNSLFAKGEFAFIRTGMGAIDRLLSNEVSLGKADFEKQQSALIKNYRTVIDKMNAYVSDTSRITASTKNKYRIISDALLQMNIEYNRVFGMSHKKLSNDIKAGYTWSNIINTRGRVITPADVKKNPGLIMNVGEADAKMTALYKALGCELCLNYETAEKVGMTKSGKTMRKKVSVAEDKGKYLTKKEILALASEKKAEVLYTQNVVFSLSTIQLIDMIAGVKNRSEDSLCFKYRESMQKGRKVMELCDVKVMFTKGGFSRENAEEYNEDKQKSFGRIHTVGEKGDNRVMNLWVYDYDFADKILVADPAKIIEVLNASGVRVETEEKTALLDRLRELKETIKSDKKKGVRARLYPSNTDLDNPTPAQQKAAKELLYQTMLQQNNRAFTLLDRKLLAEGYINDDKKKTASKKNEELSENELFVKEANEAHKKTSLSSRKRKRAKKDIADDAKHILHSYVGEKSPEFNELRKRILEYTNINATASDIESNLLEERDGMLFNESMSRLNDRMTDVYDLFYDKAERDKVEEDEVIDISVLFEPPKAQKVKVGGGLQGVHDERVALVNAVYMIKYMRNDLITGKLPRTKAERERELKCLDLLEALFDFSKGSLEVPENAEIVSDADITYIDKGKKGEKQIAMLDTSAVPLFEHEPCIEDIKQGNLGDCYFLAAIASIVENNPEDIKSMMRDNGTTVTVKLYDNNRKPKYFTIKKSVPVDVQNNWNESYAKGSYWVQYLEKAYTLLNPKNVKNARNKRNYNDIVGGDVSMAFTNLTGKELDLLELDRTFDFNNRKKQNAELTDEEIRGKYGKEINKVLRFIKDKRRTKQPIEAGTRFMNMGSGGLNNEKIGRGIAATHAYSVLGVVKVRGREMIKLRNPWGNGAMHYEVQEDSDLIVTKWRGNAENGAFYITPERFIAYFDKISSLKLDKIV